MKLLILTSLCASFCVATIGVSAPIDDIQGAWSCTFGGGNSNTHGTYDFVVNPDGTGYNKTVSARHGADAVTTMESENAFSWSLSNGVFRFETENFVITRYMIDDIDQTQSDIAKQLQNKINARPIRNVRKIEQLDPETLIMITPLANIRTECTRGGHV